MGTVRKGKASLLLGEFYTIGADVCAKPQTTRVTVYITTCVYHIPAYIHPPIHTYIHIYIYIHVYIYVYVYIYIIYIYIYIYICTYNGIHVIAYVFLDICCGVT